MRVYISACVLGLFVFDEKNRLQTYILFKKDPEEIAKKLKDFEMGKSFDELEQLKSKFKEFEIKKQNDFLKQNLRRYAIDFGFVKNQVELNQLISAISIESSKTAISTIGKRDKLIIQTVSALNDMDKILNLLSERLREWYGLHYPEFDVREHEKFAEKIIRYGKRENFEDFKTSMGMELNENDLRMLQVYAKQVKEIYSLRQELEKYLGIIVPKEIPNLNALLGSLLAARLLAHAGSLEKLAKMPSSTIQLLGAEKSLFKFLKGKEGMSKPPRFGILFTHPDVSTAKRELQGKIARLLSSKLTLAARADFYSKKDISKSLVEDYKKRLEEIKSD